MRKMGIPSGSDQEFNSEKSYTKRSGDSNNGVRTTFEMRLMRVRKNATARERRRLAEVNRAYTELSRQIPQQLLGNATKLEVLRGATHYIHMLMVMLGKNEIFNHQKDGNTSECCYESDLNMLNSESGRRPDGAATADSRGIETRDSSVITNIFPHTITATAPFSSTCHSAIRSHVIPSTTSVGANIDVSSSEGDDDDDDDERKTCTLKGECSFVRSGVLKMDDPPPKANISWR